MKTNFKLMQLFIVCGIVPSAWSASFQGLGDLPGGNFSSAAHAISADGQVVVGGSQSSNGYEAFRWTATNGMVGLRDLAGGSFYSYAFGVSADGSVIVGDSVSSKGDEAFRWTPTNGMTGLGFLPGPVSFSNSIAWAVSDDGNVIVGESSSAPAGTRDEAFRWTAAGGMAALGDLPGGNYSSAAYDVSANGSVIVGISISSNAIIGGEAFRWTVTNGMVALGDFSGGPFNSIAYGVSPDGSVVVGRGHSGVEDAFRWTAQSGLVHLGFLPCDTWSVAHACSADGAVIIGDPFQGSGDCVFIWDAQHGMRNLHTVLVNDYGLNLAGWQLSEAHGITPDGKTIVGYGVNPAGKTEGWIANLNPPKLAITRHTTNVILAWETNISGFVLERTPLLGDSNLWDTNSLTTFRIGTNFVVTNSINDGQQFFRLRKQ